MEYKYLNEYKYFNKFVRDQQTPERPEFQQYSSSSDSEQDERQLELFTKERRQRRYKRENTSVERMFRMVLDVPEIRPENLKVKVDTVHHTLVITDRRITKSNQLEQQIYNKLKRVVPLPENINFDKLRVKITLRGELLVKAPYQIREVGITKQLFRQFYTIPVAFCDFACKKRQCHQLEQFQRCPEFQHFQQFERPQTTIAEMNKYSVEEYLRLLEKDTFYNTMETQCVRDETTGKWQVMFDINTVGFRVNEVHIDFQEEERLLIVKAKHVMTAGYEFKGLCNKYLRREFILPEWLNVKQLRYRIKYNGVLRIKLPCLINPRTTHYETEQPMWEPINRYQRTQRPTHFETEQQMWEPIKRYQRPTHYETEKQIWKPIKRV